MDPEPCPRCGELLRLFHNGQSNSYVSIDATHEFDWYTGRAWWRVDCAQCGLLIDEQVVSTDTPGDRRLRLVH